MNDNAGADNADDQPGLPVKPCDAVTNEHVGVSGVTVLREVLDPASKAYFEDDLDDLGVRFALDALLPGMAAWLANENEERPCIHRAFFLYLNARRNFNHALLHSYPLEDDTHPGSGWAPGDPPPEVPERTRLIIEHYSHSIEWLNTVVAELHPGEQIEELFARGLYPALCHTCNADEPEAN
jgi:hypothetical protein